MTACARPGRVMTIPAVPRSLVVAAVLLVAPPVMADNTGSVPFRATPGDTFKVSVEIEDRHLRDGGLEAHVKRRLTYDGRIAAREPQNDGFHIGWTLRSFASEIIKDATGNQPLVLAGARSASEGLINRELVLATDASGVPSRIVDWDTHKPALATAVRRAIEETIAKAVLSRKPDAGPQMVATIAARQAEALTHTLVTGRDARAAVALIEEAESVARVQGLTLSPGQPLTVKDAARGPLTTGEVARTTTYTMSPRSGGEPLRVSWTTAFDTKALQAAAGTAIRQQLTQALVQIESESIRDEVRRKFDEQIASIRVERADTGEGEIDPATGWTRRVVRHSLTETRQDGIPTVRRERTVTILLTR